MENKTPTLLQTSVNISLITSILGNNPAPRPLFVCNGNGQPTFISI